MQNSDTNGTAAAAMSLLGEATAAPDRRLVGAVCALFGFTLLCMLLCSLLRWKKRRSGANEGKEEVERQKNSSTMTLEKGIQARTKRKKPPPPLPLRSSSSSCQMPPDACTTTT